jgi:hypothetical protein
LPGRRGKEDQQRKIAREHECNQRRPIGLQLPNLAQKCWPALQRQG